MSNSSHNSDAAPVAPGEIIAGKYRVERVIGVGGMGVVVAAKHEELEQVVAVKFLLPIAARDGEQAARFLREARAASKLTSDHVVRVHDVGRLESGAPYMIMECLEGSDLASVIQTRGPLPFALAADYLLQAIDAVAEAHRLGIIHRDLKPQNLFLARRGARQVVKVLDFGISKQTDAAGRLDLTKTSAVLGSPLYMAPEQMRSTRTVDQRADIWALGVILHELLTGRTPFLATTLPELCLMVAQDPLPPIEALRPDIPLELARVIARCLEKEPSARFGTVEELASALSPFAKEQQPASAPASAAMPTRPLSASASEAQTATAVVWGSTAKTNGAASRGSKIVAVAALGVLVVGGITLVSIRSGSRGDSGAQGAASATILALSAASPTAPLPPDLPAVASSNPEVSAPPVLANAPPVLANAPPVRASASPSPKAAPRGAAPVASGAGARISAPSRRTNW